VTTATVNGLAIDYEVLGSGGRPWIITPGGRFSKDYGGVREFGQSIADAGHTAVVWDRPNCGASDVCFEGENESAMQADALAGLLRVLDLGPTLIIGGSGGARVSLLAAARHPDVAAGVAMWWISGGVGGLIGVGNHYCGENLRAAWTKDMEAVADLPEWQEVQERNPGNRERILSQDRRQFIETFERWLLAYCPCGDDPVPGLSAADAAAMTLPALVFRSGESDFHHTRATSEALAKVLPNAELQEPPWGDREWLDRQAARMAGGALFERWSLLVPQLTEWADRVLG
jgi:pimeloyl-ACP methyl ester carboxylesterase